jgi:hydrogenase maturation protein HypF
MLYKITFQGLIQGVGFRPFLYRYAVRHRLKGYVRNTGNGVDLFVHKKISIPSLRKNLPPMARIDNVKTRKVSVCPPGDFSIKKSRPTTGFSEISPDIFMCSDCLRDLRNPHNRRFQYPFISCTNCGPRFSVVKKTPYDRKNTALQKFNLCPQCFAEYNDVSTRWYHAETIACPNCGPQLGLYINKKKFNCQNPLATAAAKINQGKIIAIKGIGGFHLVCKTDGKIVGRLRKLTGRLRKPYALMCRDLSQARYLTKISQTEKKILLSAARPIVILAKKKKEALRGVSPLDSLGIMLPYTGLHYLLFDYIRGPLVFTSANLPDYPLTTTLAEQFVPIVLDHNREIVNSCDDSVIKVVNNHPLFLRRARGYVPAPVTTVKKNTTLALGAEQNSTFALGLNSQAVISPHLGNCRQSQARQKYRLVLNEHLKKYQFKPRQIIFDKHPDYFTSRLGQKMAAKLNIKQRPIQHHQAHIASVAAEYNLGNYIGIAADGAGYGDDGTIWGGEIFICKDEIYKRVGSLEKQPLSGGDLAAVSPPRMLLGILLKFLERPLVWQIMKAFYKRREFDTLCNQNDQNFNIYQTSSTGRVLDAVATLLKICSQKTYEGEPAITLEAFSTTPYRDIEPKFDSDDDLQRLQTTPLFVYLVKNRKRDHRRLAATAQLYLARGFLEIARRQKQRLPIVWSGGVACNRIITTFLTNHGVLVNKNIPPGDGGIAFGQLNI